MSISDNSGEPGSSPSGRIDVGHIKDMVNGLAKKKFVGGTLEVDTPDPDVIVAAHVNIKFGWTNVIAMRAAGDGKGMIGTVHIRTTCPSLAPATVEDLTVVNYFECSCVLRALAMRRSRCSAYCSWRSFRIGSGRRN